MEDLAQQELETFEEPEQTQPTFNDSFDNAFEGIGKDIENSCNELTEKLDNLNF